MLISFPFLPGSSNGNVDIFEQSALNEIVTLDEYESPHGIFPISRDRRWHGGVHLTPKMVNEPVRAVADGVVVAYRVAQDSLDGHDTSFVLLKHETETGTGRSIAFYSLYMHLMNQADLKTRPALKQQMAEFMQTATASARQGEKIKVYRKDILGYPGQMFGHRMIHFEIFMTDADFKAYFDKTQLDNRTISATSSEEPWGDCYFVIPPGPFLSKPDKSSAEAGRTEHALFVRIRFDRGTKYTTVWRDEGNGKAPTLITSAAGVAVPNYEYDLYKTATKQYPDCASAGYELLRFGRVVGPDKDRLPADKSANWQSVSFAAQQSGYINLSDARVCKLSDADFPWFMGWTKVSEGAGALSDDGLCDSKVILDLLQEANGVDVPKAGASLDRLALYLRDHEEVRQKLRGLICEAPTEWDRSTNHKRFDRLTQAGEHYEGNPEGLDEFLQFVEKFQFWDTTGLPTKVWHFHPLKFIECIKKCSWLSQRETIQLLPVSAMRPHKGAFVSEKVVVDQSIIDQFRPDLNRALRKYGIVTADRMAAFFGNAMQEIQWFGKLYENASSQWYYPWDGRGLLQLTGPGNYIKYWRWRGRDIAKDVESALVEAYNKKDHAALQDAKNVGVTTMMKQWRDDIAGILTSTTYERSDSAGAYWAWTEASRFADRPSKMERAGKLVEGGRGIYYKNQSFGQVAATVNFGSPVSNIASVERVNGIVARYQGFTNALVVLADTPQFPDGAGRLLSIPESFERRK